MVNLKDIGGRVVNVAHRNIFRVSKGKIAGTALGMPVVELVTIGRKTGKKRPTMLTAPVVDGDTVVLVASWGGDERNPLWYRNLEANPEVEITMSGRHRDMAARTATVDEKAELWPRIVAANKGYAGYQTKTDRDIPVVILEPR